MSSELDVPTARTSLQLPHGAVQLPAFLPDATLGVVRGVDSADLECCGIEALVMNSFHLMQRPGSSTVQALGGLHRMSGWRRPIVTDSGGFQAYSLIRQNPRYGSLNDKGITFQPDGAARKFHFSPEKSIQLQLSYGADIVICLDDCTHVDDSPAEQALSVQRTVAWARRCKREFERLVAQKGLELARRPLLFGVIQGGGSFELRQRCAGDLLEIGFDGFGFGGWPLDDKGNLLTDIIAYTRELVPLSFPMHALGVGHPANVVECFRLGYDLFDSAMPTRDARHGRLYRFEGAGARATNGSENAGTRFPQAPAAAGAGTDASSVQELAGKWFSYVYINDEQHIKSDQPISPGCDCLCCTRYSRGYLHHLFKIGDGLFIRLATIHNLRFMAQLMKRLQTS